MSTPLATPGAIAAGSLAASLGTTRKESQPAAGAFHKVAELLESAALLLLVILLIPVAILIVGTPVALFVRLLLEIARLF